MIVKTITNKKKVLAGTELMEIEEPYPRKFGEDSTFVWTLLLPSDLHTLQ